MNTAMLLERQKALRADPYERSDERTGYANGFKPRTFNTRMGAMSLQVPQTRGVEFYPSMLEKGQRTEKAFMAALAEMYVHGTSTRKVKNIVETMCGFEVSSTQVSKAAAELDKVLGPWRQRDLGAMAFVYLARISHRLSFCQSFESTAVCLELWLCSVEFNCRQLATQLTK
jgi:putative transposase